MNNRGAVPLIMENAISLMIAEPWRGLIKASLPIISETPPGF